MNHAALMRRYGCNVALTHMLCVILGAPLIDRVVWTLLFSIVFVVIGGGRPYELYFGDEAAADDRRDHVGGTEHRHSSNSKKKREHHQQQKQQRTASRTIILAVVSWVGGILAPLDWDVWYQMWPLPSAVLLVVGTLVLAIPSVEFALQTMLFARMERGCWAPSEDEADVVSPIHTRP
jgi:cation transport ATPase